MPGRETVDPAAMHVAACATIKSRVRNKNAVELEHMFPRLCISLPLLGFFPPALNFSLNSRDYYMAYSLHDTRYAMLQTVAYVHITTIGLRRYPGR